MKKVIRLSSVLLALLIAISILPGCNSAKNDFRVQKDSTVNKKRDPIALEIWMPINQSTAKSYSTLDEHPVVKEIEKKYGIELKFTHPASADGGEQINLMIASGTYPDLIKHTLGFYQGGLEGAIKDGIIININDYLDKHAPNFKKFLNGNPEINKVVRSDSGTILKFGATFPDKQGQPNYGPLIRKDLLDQLNLSIPQTIDEWYLVLKTFKDKLGIDTPFGFPGGGGLSYLEGAFSGAYGVPNNGFYQEKDKVQFGPMQPGFRDFLTTFNKWYQEGLIVKDFNAIKIAEITKRVTAGTVVAHAGHNTHFSSLYSSVGGKSQNFTLAAVPYPSLKKGEKPRFRHFSDIVTNAPLLVTNACKHPAEAVEFIDYLHSPEGQRLTVWGIEGEGHTIVNGKPAYTELITKNPDGLNFGDAMRKYSLNDLTTLFSYEAGKYQYSLPEQIEAFETWTNSADYDGYLPTGLTLTAEEGDKFQTIMSEISTYSNQMTIKFILGTEPIVNFDAFVQQIKKMGIDEAVKIQQAALDRYNKK